MASPECGDLILRGSLSAGFLVIDAASQRRLFGPVQLQKAVRLAKEHGAQVIWQQLVDDSGQPLGPPLQFKVPPMRSSDADAAGHLSLVAALVAGEV